MFWDASPELSLGEILVVHQYREWLLTTVANILDDDLTISSAGLLRDEAIAWVEVSVPESITTPEGVSFRPNLLATTRSTGFTATISGLPRGLEPPTEPCKL